MYMNQVNLMKNTVPSYLSLKKITGKFKTTIVICLIIQYVPK